MKTTTFDSQKLQQVIDLISEQIGSKPITLGVIMGSLRQALVAEGDTPAEDPPRED